MRSTDHPRILFSERLSDGIMVHFGDGVSTFFGAQFLYEQRFVSPNKQFQTQESADLMEDEKKSLHLVHLPAVRT